MYNWFLRKLRRGEIPDWSAVPIGVYVRRVYPRKRPMLTPHQRAAIFWDRMVVRMSLAAVAAKYGTTVSTVCAIQRGDWNPHRRVK
jgi:hypothetical protein